MRADPSGSPSLDVDGDHNRIIALVAASTRKIPPGLIGHFNAAGVHWRRGNKVQAHIHLAFTGLPRLDGPDEAFPLFSPNDFCSPDSRPSCCCKSWALKSPKSRCSNFRGSRASPPEAGARVGNFRRASRGMSRR